MKFANWFGIALVAIFSTAAHADIILTANVTYVQNFDTLTSTPDGGTSSTLPDSPNGWTFDETNNSADTTYGIGNGSSAAGNTYSFGSTGSTERAFGTLGQNSPTRNQTLGARFVSSVSNTNPLTKAILAYTGEQWRLGAAGRLDRLDFQISTDATSLTTGTWTDINALDFIAPITAGTLGALDGNLAANRTIFATTKIALPTAVAPGATFWIRWSGFDASGAEDGLSIDNFSLTAIPEPPTTLAIAAMLVAMAFVGWRRRAALTASPRVN